VQAQAFDFQTLVDAGSSPYRNHVIECFERADREPGARRCGGRLVTFVPSPAAASRGRAGSRAA
jgi:hypothetical protein